MKKFFSLVLALVMALSLTTVAWGADPVAVVGTTEYDDLQTAVTAAASAADKTVTLLDDVTVSAGITVPAGVIIDGAGYTLKVTGAGDKTADGTTAALKSTDGFTVMNLTIDGGARGIYVTGPATADFGFYNVKIVNSYRAFNVSGTAAADVDLYVYNSTLAGKVSYTETLTSVTFTNCTFVKTGAAGAQDVVEPWGGQTTFNNCVFADGYKLDMEDTAVRGGTVIVEDCTYAGAPVTSANISSLAVNTTGAGVVAPTSEGSTTPALYDLHKADFAGTEVAGDTSYVTVAAVKEADGSGSLAYIKMNGKFFVEIAAADATTSDYYVTEANKNVPLFYMAQIDSPIDVAYSRIAVEFNDFGVKCGQMNVPYTYTVAELGVYVYTAPVTGDKTYFVEYDATFDYGTLAAPYFNGAQFIGNTQILVDNEVVQVRILNTEDVLNEHAFAPVAYDKTTPVSALCGLCGAKATVYKDGKAPAGSDYFDVTFGTDPYDVVIVAAGGSVVVPSTPSTDKVTSADTFDAGIAMYVGMSVMAAAGSAVVIGKKKD